MSKDNYYNELMQHIVKESGEDGLSAFNIVDIVMSSIIFLEHLTHIPGSEKKDMLIKVLNAFVDEHMQGKPQVDMIKGVIEFSVPVLIDVIISLDKGKIKIHNLSFLKKICLCC